MARDTIHARSPWRTPLARPDETGSYGYPRPLLRRADWTSLDGVWSFALDPEAALTSPAEVDWKRAIEVPFAPETSRSGIGETGFLRACWYRRFFEAPRLRDGERLILHFGAVDYAATVWIDGSIAGRHEGGYTPFSLDITDLLQQGKAVEIVVRAEDDPHDLAKPRGKQDWELEPHSIWYPRTTGIWQTVWMERVPATWIGSLFWTPNLERWEIDLLVKLTGARKAGLSLAVRLTAGDLLLAHDTYTVVHGEIHRRIALSDPGIDDSRNRLLWSPARPTLIEAELTLSDEDGKIVDHVMSYTALRSLSVQQGRLVLNGRPYMLRMVLDQGYWPETGLTPPGDDALRRDVELAKEMGFNGVRKHQKVEDPRYYYWADRLGLLVWTEMPSAYRFTKESIERLTREWVAVLDRDHSHPCIIAWVPINESWGVPNLPDSPSERHYVRSLYHLTKTLDPSRIVIGNDGWESVATDVIGIHDYDPDPASLSRRYHAEAVLPRLFRRERPGGRMLVLDTHHAPHAAHLEHPIILSEFGGIAMSKSSATWGYSRSSSPEGLALRYGELLDAVRSLEILAGFCYTQFADTYQEANGLLYADRTPKFPIELIAVATRGRSFPASPTPDGLERMIEP
ncbi:MAG: glycoside hydrolase family 2 protein, partial [Byssovorax sp.]